MSKSSALGVVAILLIGSPAHALDRPEPEAATAGGDPTVATETLQRGNVPGFLIEALKDAEAGVVPAMNTVAQFYQNGNLAVVRDDRKSAYWFARTALRGHVGAERDPGVMEATERVPAMSQSDALALLEKASAAGDLTAAMFEGTILCTDPTLSAEDHAKGMAILTKAATAGFEPAQESLADMYLSGTGTTKDVDEANFWFAVAALAPPPAGNRPRRVIGDLAKLHPDQAAKVSDRASKWVEDHPFTEGLRRNN